jgi:predicted DNA-binding protein
MEKKPNPKKTDAKQLDITLPEELLERIQTLCDERGMTIQDFVTDAIIEKLELAHKERREKNRL